MSPPTNLARAGVVLRVTEELLASKLYLQVLVYIKVESLRVSRLYCNSYW